MEISVYLILILCALPKYTLSDVANEVKDDENLDSRYIPHNTTIQEYPYQVHLTSYKDSEKLRCGGSILSRRYVLTAARCLSGASRVTARVGSTYSNKGGREYHSDSYKLHPKYNARTSEYDVGYVRYVPPIKIDGVNSRLAHLPRSGRHTHPGTTLTITTWNLKDNDGYTARHLMVYEAPVVSNVECRQHYNTVTNRMMCAGQRKHNRRYCMGQSGSPAVNEDGIQMGIMSYGSNCYKPGYHGLYTNVSSVRRWLNRHTNDNNDL